MTVYSYFMTALHEQRGESFFTFEVVTSVSVFAKVI